MGVSVLTRVGGTFYAWAWDLTDETRILISANFQKLSISEIYYPPNLPAIR